jgi:hypothetical protein
MGDMVNPMPKYVVQHLSGDLVNATLLDGPEDSIPKLKDEVDGDLFMHGARVRVPSPRRA